MGRDKELENELIIALQTNERISNRFVVIGEKVKKSLVLIGQLQNQVYALLVYLGYDLKSQEFLDAHNNAFNSLSENLDELIETFAELRNNLSNFREIYKEIDEMGLQQFGFWEIE